MGCFWGKRNNNSYVSGATSSGQSLSSRFDSVFDEKTTQSENIACSERFNCHISCSCASGWSSSAPSGDYVYFDAPGGAVVFSAEKTLSEINTIDSMATSRTLTSITPSSANDKSFRLSQTPQNYTVSVMSSSGGRCYKAACPSGYYLEKPNDTYFTVGSATGTVSGVVCYKATKNRCVCPLQRTGSLLLKRPDCWLFGQLSVRGLSAISALFPGSGYFMPFS